MLGNFLSKTLLNKLKYQIKNWDSQSNLHDMVDHLVDVPDSKEIDFLYACDHMTDFKNTNGVFLKRRVKKVLKEYLQQGFINDDDLSIGCFHEEW